MIRFLLLVIMTSLADTRQCAQNSQVVGFNVTVEDQQRGVQHACRELERNLMVRKQSWVLTVHDVREAYSQT
jgi:hypothetical protein